MTGAENIEMMKAKLKAAQELLEGLDLDASDRAERLKEVVRLQMEVAEDLEFLTKSE